MTVAKRFAVVAVALALAACATTEPRLPAVDLPTPTATHVAGIERWWAQFNDPQLTTLIEEALAANLDLRLAVARIDEARASCVWRARSVPDIGRRTRRPARTYSQSTDLFSRAVDYDGILRRLASLVRG